MSVYDTQYSKLNAAQKAVVDTIEGPMLVVAGPGTGKTQVVAMRVAAILKRTQMKPYNILCLTYSVSGATAMRERLRTIIGPDAYGITVTTIHGFCNTNVIQAFPEVFHDQSLSEHCSDIERFEILNECIDELPVDAVIVRSKDRYGKTDLILKRISQMKREGKTPASLHSIARTFREEMSGKSREGTKAHEKNLRLSAQFDEFITLFESYERTLRERELYDYDDMILFVTRALHEEQWLLSALQERFQYMLIDEYQDTNGAQNALINALSTIPHQLPNLCAVGDDDQAIYRFQGASVRTMTDFISRFPMAPIVTLTESYRSTQQILDAAGLLISCNTDRLAGSVPSVIKTLSSRAAVPTGSQPSMMRPASDAVEGPAIVEHIEGVLSSGVPPKEIAVLTRTNHELVDLYDTLKKCGIPAQMSGKLDLLHQPSVRECITMLQAIDNLRSDATLASALAVPCFTCHPADLGQVWMSHREHTVSRHAAKQSYVPLCDFLLSIDAPHDQSLRSLLRAPDALLHARDVLLTLSQNRETLTLPALIEKLMKQSGLLPVSIEDIRPIEYAAIQEFYEHVKHRCLSSPSFSLSDLIREIDCRERYNLRLVFSVPHLMTDAVQLMTAHGSKGLEFDAVILASFREKHWDHKRPSSDVSLPDHLLFSETDDLSLEDERRLTYVAWTRARKHLTFSCPLQITRGDRQQDCSPSQFFSEGGNLQEAIYDLRDQRKAMTLLRSPSTLQFDDELKTFLRKKLEGFELSVTSLNNFLNNPEKFLWEDLLSVPRAKEPHFAYGSAVHAALLEWGRQMKSGALLTLDALIETFSTALSTHEVITDKDRKHWLHIGTQSLPRYYRERLASPHLIGGLEKRLSARMGEVRLKGFLDRFDLYHESGRNVHVIDYKTGTPKTDKQVKEEYNGSTFRQLVFYKLLTDLSSDFGGYEATEFSFDFIGEGEHEPRRITFEITQNEVTALKELIREVWDKIHALDFIATAPVASESMTDPAKTQ